jgi:hypothetical protein
MGVAAASARGDFQIAVGDEPGAEIAHCPHRKAQFTREAFLAWPGIASSAVDISGDQIAEPEGVRRLILVADQRIEPGKAPAGEIARTHRRSSSTERQRMSKRRSSVLKIWRSLRMSPPLLRGEILSR